MRILGAVVVLALAGCALRVPRAVEWTALDSGVGAGLRGVSAVSAVSARVAWASGEAGTVLRTRDSGRSWQRVAAPGGAARSWRDVHAFDAERAQLMNAGAPAVLLRTEDGGCGWREVYRDDDPAAFLDAIALDAGGARGLAFGDPVDGRFTVLGSDDGGRSWRLLEGLPAPVAGEAGFAASGTMVALAGGARLVGTGGAAARVLRQGARGGPWAAHPTPLRQGADSQGIFSLAFSAREPRLGVAVGGDYRYETDPTDTAAWTDDGGRTWQPAARAPRGYRSCVAWVPGTRAAFVAVGPTGAELSVDGGRSWEPCGDVGYHALAFAPDGAGWAVGAGGRVARVAAR